MAGRRDVREKRLELRALGEVEEAEQHDAEPQGGHVRAGQDDHAEGDGTRDIDADDERFATEAVGQPAGDQWSRHAEGHNTAYISATVEAGRSRTWAR